MNDDSAIEPLPERRNRALAEIYFYLLVAGLVGSFAIYKLITFDMNLILPIAAAGVGIVAIFFGGTRLMLPVYYATTFGTILQFPGMPVSINRLAAAGLFLAAVTELPFRRMRYFASSATFCFFLFQIYYLPAAFILKPPGAEYPWESFFYILVTVVLMVRYWQERWLRAITWGFVLVSAAMVILPGAYELVTSHDITPVAINAHLDRLNGLSVNSIFYAFTALWTVPLAATLMLESRRIPVKVCLCIIIATLVMLSLMTANRQTPLILFFMVVVYTTLIRSRHKFAIVVVLVLAALAAVPFVLPKLAERYEMAHSVKSDASLSERHDKLEVARVAVLSHPWFGIGHNYFKDTWKQYRPLGKTVLIQYIEAKYRYIDMGYMQIVTEYGFIGGAIVLCLFAATAVTYRRFYRLSRQLKDSWHTNFLAAIAALFTQLLVSMLVQDTFVTPRTFMMYGCFFAVCISIQLQTKKLATEQQAIA
ncbi:hypothetical protein BH09SUM1_BH09SUM1_33420 [soil metagenome]